MKQKVEILRNGESIFKKKIQNLPIKEEYIKEKSIELFDDEDPCIIHQSYVVKEYVDEILTVLNKEKQINMKDHLQLFSCLKYENIEELTIILLG